MLPDGTVVGFAECGDPDGEPVLYLHGTPSSRLETSGDADERARSVGVRVLAPDRPGIGLSSFRRYSVADYPELVRALADHLGVERFAVVGLSGGARYACACAWRLGGRVTRLVVVSGTCSSDVPGVRETWSKQDRQAYLLATRAPWLLRAVFARTARGLRRGDASGLLGLFPPLPPADEEVLARETVRSTLLAAVSEALRQGTRGVTHDYALEARPWGVPLQEISVPCSVWHGEEDSVVSVEQGRILAALLPDASARFLPGHGHLSLIVDRLEDVLTSAVTP